MESDEFIQFVNFVIYVAPPYLLLEFVSMVSVGLLKGWERYFMHLGLSLAWLTVWLCFLNDCEQAHCILWCHSKQGSTYTGQEG